MSTVYVAIFFGGRTGKAATVNTGTGYVNITGNGLHHGVSVAFTPGSSLPSVSGTALTADTKYYVSVVDANNFALFYDEGLTNQIIFTTSGSSLFVYAGEWGEMSAADRLQYGEVGSERAYDSIASSVSPLLSLQSYETDFVVRILSGYTVTTSASLINMFIFRTFLVTTFINGVPTNGFHYGDVAKGYRTLTTNAVSVQPGMVYEGLNLIRNATSTGTTGFVILSYSSAAYRCLITNNQSAYSAPGIYLYSNAIAGHNIISGFKTVSITSGVGIIYRAGQFGMVAFNNTITDCYVGMAATSASTDAIGAAYNNLVVGCTFADFGLMPKHARSVGYGNIGSTLSKRTVTFSTYVYLTNVQSLLSPTQLVYFTTTGTLPSPLVPNKLYVVSSTTTSYFSIKEMNATADITILDGGSGTHSVISVWDYGNTYVPLIDTSDYSLVFEDWANKNYYPAGYGTATPGSQVLHLDNAVSTEYAFDTDILGKAIPSYNNGAPEGRDVGAFEFDYGYTRPESATLNITNIVDGSRVKVTRNDTGTVLYNNVPGTSLSYLFPYAGPVSVLIRKASATPYYREFNAAVTLVANQTTELTALQQLDE